MKQPQQNDYKITGLFPVPIHIAKRDSNLDSKQEKAEIKDFIENGLHKNYGNSSTINSYVFNDKLKNIKQFCEQQLEIYVEQTINSKEGLDFYITQSWLNVSKPGEFHHEHCHPNSIISGVFYVSTVEDDKITFRDPNIRLRDMIKFPEPKEFNVWNSRSWFIPVQTNDLILFPSWLDHLVEGKQDQLSDRISISFNTFIRGTLGKRIDLTELIL